MSGSRMLQLHIYLGQGSPWHGKKKGYQQEEGQEPFPVLFTAPNDLFLTCTTSSSRIDMEKPIRIFRCKLQVQYRANLSSSVSSGYWQEVFLCWWKFHTISASTLELRKLPFSFLFFPFPFPFQWAQIICFCPRIRQWICNSRNQHLNMLIKS